MTTLTDGMKRRLRRQLEANRKELRTDIYRAIDKRDQYECLAGEVPDTGDSSVAVIIVDLARVALGRDLARLRLFDEALRRFRNGSYGFCTDCGMEIPIERLYAQLTAERCVACQTIFERKQAGYRSSAVV